MSGEEKGRRQKKGGGWRRTVKEEAVDSGEVAGGSRSVYRESRSMDPKNVVRRGSGQLSLLELRRA